MIRTTFLFTFLCLLVSTLSAQTGIVRGIVYDKDSGEPVPFAFVLQPGTTFGTTTDAEGFYNLASVPVGELELAAFSIGYDTASAFVSVKAGSVISQNFYLAESGIQLQQVDISAKRDQDKTETRVSVIEVTPQEIKSLPSTGGDADIAQYLTVLPGVISSGDQGGQLFIRGGSPVQNKIILDGMTIHRPFHSIGLYSVFETEMIKNAEIHTGGFNAEYGGRISAIVDLTTRAGSKKEISGLVGVSPFQGRFMLEGPLNRFEEGSPGSVSFILSAKHSWLDETSKTLYDYASDDAEGLPFSYTDLYGKLSFIADNGSSFNVFGFNFQDDVKYPEVANIGWDASGGGFDFHLIPPNSNLIFGGNVSYSNYGIELIDAEGEPRSNQVDDLNLQLDFTYFGYNSELNYGINVNALSTEFSFVNFLDLNFNQKVNNTDIAVFGKYKQIFGNVIAEPGLRIQYYAGQSEFSIEPRLGLKWNATDDIRLKFAGGLYSQNLISTVSERDIVNLFFGYLSSPEGSLYQPGSTLDLADHPLQKSTHLVAGIEWDVNRHLQLNVEPYYKRFDQLIALNRNKRSSSDPNFVTETGDARGIDLSLSYDYDRLNVWATYSLGFVDRNNGEQVYAANFDRRHNINLLTTYRFGNDRSWSASARWNLGTGFPFTQILGFYGYYNFFNTTDFDYIEDNPDLTPIFDPQINNGRLPSYHRLDFSLQKRFDFGQRAHLQITAAVTNVYNRENIFYLDVLSLDRVDQLPILPSLGVELGF